MIGMSTPAYCIFIDTVFEGRVPHYRDGEGNPLAYATRVEAEREIAEDAITRLEEFLAGQRDFDDAMTVEEYILDVDVLPDGVVVDEDGNCFSPRGRC